MKINLLNLTSYPILKQLQLEEALLRTSKENWCLINNGSERSIVMGISGKPSELIDEKKVRRDEIPLVKRFSGGGTVIVDENTLFVTFIFNKEEHHFSAFPEPILKWSETLYKTALNMPSFALRENDYVIGNHKCGGNAQYIQKERWLHHTTFLWDYAVENMSYLLYPPKTPSYRSNRSHDEFLCRLKTHFPTKKSFLDPVIAHLSKLSTVHSYSLNEALLFLLKEHRKTTILL